MGQRALIYTLHVHKKYKPDELVPLGDIDGQGTYLGTYLESMFKGGFAAESDDTNKEVRCDVSQLAGDDLQLAFLHGESGLVADIMNEHNQLRLRQAVTDKQLVRCGSLFRLPRNQKHGWWAVHVNNNRAAKGLVQTEMVKRFRRDFPELMLVVRPSVMSAVLRQALDDERLKSIKLVKYDRSSDFAYANQWLAQNTRAKIELRVSPLARGGQLVAKLARKAIGGDDNAYGKIVSFAGLDFDEARLEVTLENGYERTFRLRGPEGGHPLPADINPKTRDGEPTDKSVWEQLGRVLTEME
jgi:hypothetical protein